MADERLRLSVLGCEIIIEFMHSKAAAQARRLLAPLLTDTWSTPDFVLTCRWRELNRWFIRSRTNRDGTALDGIEVYSSEFPGGTPWNSLDPPFPPVGLAPLAERFIRLHSAAVSDGLGRVLLILGDSGFGKTTLSTVLCAEHGYRLLTDEDVFLYRRSNVVEPFANGDGPWLEAGKAAPSLWSMNPELVSKQPGVVRGAVCLRSSQDGPGVSPQQISGGALFRMLLRSQRPGGSREREGIATLARLARLISGFELPGQDYDSLRKAAGPVAGLLT